MRVKKPEKINHILRFQVVLACREKGVIHGDIKDENILVNVVTDRPEIQLIDFGSGAHYSGEVFAEFGGEISKYSAVKNIRIIGGYK